jgi:WD40 repeat protein
MTKIDDTVPASDDTLPASDAPGTDLPDLPVVDREKYVVTSELARGGMGRILRARDRRLDRPVAIKEVLPGNEQLARRFEREARMTARLQHPAIVNVYEAGRWPTGELFFAMKLVEGRPLEHAISETETVAERIALLPHVIRVAEALAYAHGERVIHRDLKSANVLVGAYGETVVIDWGLAKDMTAGPDADDPLAHQAPSDKAGTDKLTAIGAVMGTPAFMPPEQARGDEVDERADVYAIGAILYHLLAGETAYTGKSSIDVLRKVLEAPPLPLERRVSQLPRELLAIVAKAMAREPHDRYPTARELAEDLERFQHGQLVAAHHYTPLALARRWIRRHRVPLAVAIALVAGGTAVVTQRVASRERAAAVALADERAIAEARALVQSDPAAAIGALLKLSPESTHWSAARMIAADARAQGLARVLRGHDDRISNLVFAPSGKQLASASADTTIRVWDLASGEARVMRGHSGPITDLAFSPDGRWLVSGSTDRTVQLWEVTTGANRVWVGHGGAVLDVAFSPDGTRVASAGRDQTIRVWEVPSGRSRVLSGHHTPVARVAWSPRGDALASAGADGVRLWDLAGNGSSIDEHPARLVAYAPSGELASAGEDGLIRIFKADGTFERVLAGHDGAIERIEFAKVGSHLASAAADATVRLWDPATGAGRVLGAHEGQVFDVAFDPSGNEVASVGRDGTVRVFSVVGDERRVLRGHRGSVTAVAFGNGVLASGGTDHGVRLWNPSGEALQTHGDPPPLPHEQVQATSAGLTATAAEAVIRLSNGTVLRGHEGRVLALAFSPHGNELASGSDDRTVRLWDLASGESRVLVGHAAPVAAVAFSADGKQLVSTGTDGTSRVWADDLPRDPATLSGTLRDLVRNAR